MPLLPNEPIIDDDAAQRSLTEQFLMPVLCEVATLFLALRQSLDTELCQARPFKQGKPYPLGQCLEISEALFKRLPLIEPAMLKPDAARGWHALRSFTQQGGLVRQVWGDLRGEYFQNAFIIGVLYVDVANDTVDPGKHPVEILPFEQAKLSSIRDFGHFSMVAARYWQARIYPNHLIPSLAPYFPLISVTTSGFVQLQSASNYMIALAEESDFQSSETVLKTTLMNASLFHLLRNNLSPNGFSLPHSPTQGQNLAVTSCVNARQEQWKTSPQTRNRAVANVVKLNQALSRLTIKA